MQKIYQLVIVAIAFAACNQNNTIPNNNNVPTNQCTNLPNIYLDLNYNGNTIHWEGSKFVNTLLQVDSGLVSGSIVAGGGQTTISIVAAPLCNTSQVGKQQFQIFANRNTANIGVGTFSLNGFGGLADHINNGGTFQIPDSTVVINVTSLSSNYITGNFTCKVVSNTSGLIYPANGSFNLLRKYQ
jgi:hypothetical protein